MQYEDWILIIQTMFFNYCLFIIDDLNTKLLLSSSVRCSPALARHLRLWSGVSLKEIYRPLRCDPSELKSRRCANDYCIHLAHVCYQVEQISPLLCHYRVKRYPAPSKSTRYHYYIHTFIHFIPCIVRSQPGHKTTHCHTRKAGMALSKRKGRLAGCRKHWW